jgi:phage-related protein (TIGR01555 family)
MSDSKPKPMKITEAMLLAFAGDLAPEQRREFKVPSLPPGVVPKGAKFALDSCAPLMGWMNSSSGFCGLGFPGYTFLAELAQRSEYRAATETTANEMTREWLVFTGAKPDQQKELEQAFVEFNVRAVFRDCERMDGFFGRGNLHIGIKGQENDKRQMLPLFYGPETIKKGSLKSLKAVEPIWTTPVTYNAIDPTSADFYRPSMWYMLSKRVHASRLLQFVSRPLPDMLKPAYNFSGMSLSQLMEPYVQRWLKTVDSVNRLISNYSTSGIMTNMQATLEGGQNDSSLVKRAQLFAMLRDSRGLLLLDKDSEEFFQYNTPLNALPDLQAQAQEHMAAPSHIPLVKLTGISPAGLNASSEGELKVWYDHIAASQVTEFNPNMDIILKIIQCHLWGKIDPNIGYQWVELDSPTDKELSEMRKGDAQADGVYLDKGIVGKKEVRQRLRKSATSGYSFLENDEPPEDAEELVDKETAPGEEGGAFGGKGKKPGQKPGDKGGEK